MNDRVKRHLVCMCMAVCVLAGLSSTQGGETSPEADAEIETLYHGIEVNGVLCGYMESTLSPAVHDGKEVTLLEQRVFVMVSALGAEVNSEIDLTYHLDPATWEFSYHDSHVSQGSVELSSVVSIDGDRAHCAENDSGEVTTVELPPDVTLENPLVYPHLLRDFVEGGLDERSYEVFEVRDTEIQKTTYTKVGTEEVELAGARYDAIILDKMNHVTGLKVRMWLDVEDGRLLKAVHAAGRVIYLADPTIVKKIEIANLDEDLTSRVDVAIADFRSISYMKVKATIEPSGLWITPEGLNVPGQRFEGTVKDNLVEGVFEIEHQRYDGSGAPLFPSDFSGVQDLKEYLEPDDFIESDDPVLIRQAEEIVEGSRDSWEAACRLSKWVSDSIAYAIPGGATARNTYDTRSGECGSHSVLLAAFCRAVGIPARVVWGCMYVPNFGGSFGQHAWNEIYMGENGWIPVDATAAETDYVDSGHLRIGTLRSSTIFLNPQGFEVLDYRAGEHEMGGLEETVPLKYEAYVGEYTSEHDDETVLSVFVQAGNLAVDIPDKVVLALEDVDEEGVWYCKLTRQLYFIFTEDSSGRVTELELHELISMPKQSEPEEVDDTVPDEFRPHLGDYFFRAAQAKFTVSYEGGTLEVYDPLEKTEVKLQLPDEKGRWVDEYDKNAISFEFDEEGGVKSMRIDVVNRFRR